MYPYVEMQTINTEIGEFQSQVIDIDPKGLRGVFKKSRDANVILYLNDQSPAIPVKLKSKVRVGSFLCDSLTEACIKENQFKDKK